MAMSRLMGPAVLLAGCTAFWMPARAQEAGDITAEEAIDNYRAAWSVKEPEVDPCAEEAADADTIVVCRKRAERERYMIETEIDPRLNETGSGAPRAPDVNSLPPCESYAVCVKGLGRVPPPVHMIDFSALPETPAGSDAARLYGGPTDENVEIRTETVDEDEEEEPDIEAGLQDDVIGP